MSKGSQPRQQRDDAAYRSNWEAIFGKVSQWTGKITMPHQTCGNCKHYTKHGVTGRNGDCTWFVCKNPVLMDMVGPDTYGRFQPPADFGCNRWETKE